MTFQVQRYVPQQDHRAKPWVTDPHDGWAPVEDSCGCVDQAFIEADRHRAYWAGRGVKVKASEMRVVEFVPAPPPATGGGG